MRHDDLLNEGNDIPRHRRKKNKKTASKSNHKHVYEISEIEQKGFSFRTTGDENLKYMIFLEESCTICGKTKRDLKFLTKNEFIELQEKLNHK